MRVRGIVPGLAALVLAACGTTTVVREEALPPARPVAPVDRPVPPPSGPTHRVQPGDTLYNISRRYRGLTVEKLRELNNLKSDDVKPGQKLIVRS